MDPLRKRFYVNGEPVTGSTLHAEYLKPANTLLAEVKRRMQAGGLQQLAQRYTTDDGATLTAMSRFGQDEIRIDVPQSSRSQSSEQVMRTLELDEAFQCVWGPNVEIYADIPYLGLSIQTPVMDSRKRVVCVRGGAADDQVIVFNARTLARTSQFTIDADMGLVRGNVAIDTKTDRFYVETGPGPVIFEPDNLTPVQMSFPFSAPDKISTGPACVSANAGAFYTVARRDASSQNFHELFDALTMESLASVEVFGEVNVSGSVSQGLGHSDRGGTFSWEFRILGGLIPLSLNIIPLRDGTNTMPAVPPISLSEYLLAGAAYVVAQNNGSTLWAWINVGVSAGVSKVLLARYRGSEWEFLSVEGVTDEFIVDGMTRGARPLLVHDPVTDVVIVGRNDGTGVWVFNAKDCNFEPEPPFSVRFRHAPVAPFAWGISQIHDASMMVWFSLTAETPFITRIGRIDIGRLKQTRIKVR